MPLTQVDLYHGLQHPVIPRGSILGYRVIPSDESALMTALYNRVLSSFT